MAWLVVNKDNSEYIFNKKPDRVVYIDDQECLYNETNAKRYPAYWSNLLVVWDPDKWKIQMPKGTVFLLTGKQLSFNDDPIELNCSLIQERIKQYGMVSKRFKW